MAGYRISWNCFLLKMVFSVLSFSFWQRRLFPLPLAGELEGTAGCPAKAWCLREDRREVIRLAQQCAIIYEASPFLTFPLFMQCNFNVINTKRLTAERWELPSFISEIKLLLGPRVAFPFNCLLGWSPGFKVFPDWIFLMRSEIFWGNFEYCLIFCFLCRFRLYFWAQSLSCWVTSNNSFFLLRVSLSPYL